jgi:hypothetical protein
MKRPGDVTRRAECCTLPESRMPRKNKGNRPEPQVSQLDQKIAEVKAKFQTALAPLRQYFDPASERAGADVMARHRAGAALVRESLGLSAPEQILPKVALDMKLRSPLPVRSEKALEEAETLEELRKTLDPTRPRWLKPRLGDFERVHRSSATGTNPHRQPPAQPQRPPAPPPTAKAKVSGGGGRKGHPEDFNWPVLVANLKEMVKRKGRFETLHGEGGLLEWCQDNITMTDPGEPRRQPDRKTVERAIRRYELDKIAMKARRYRLDKIATKAGRN